MVDSVWKRESIPTSSTVTTKTPDPNAGFKGSDGKPTSDPNSLLIFNKTDAQRKGIAQALKDAGLYRGPINGRYSKDLADAYTNAVIGAAEQTQRLGREFSVEEYLIQEAAANAGSDVKKPSISGSISDPTRASATVNAVIANVLGREATAKEVKDLSKILNDAEKKNLNRTVDGITTGGIDREQFLIDLIKTGKYADKTLGKLPTLGKLAEEVKTRKGEKKGLLTQDLQTVAKANGLTLSDAQLQNYAKEIEGGKDIKVIQNQIRQSASLGMPDSVKKLINEGTDLETVYAPYRNRMAAILEVNPDSIDLNDSALRMAIGPDKEMSLYDFQRQLRKDSRWQYTSQAKQEVSDAALKILQDFGFQG